MKKHILALSFAAAFMLPAHAQQSVDDEAATRAKARAEEARERARVRSEEARARADEARKRGEEARARGEEARRSAEEWSEWARNFSADFSNSMAFMFTDRAGRGRVVKGAPYSADIVTETNQSLADGNVITHRNVSKVWRDGEGRTRQEIWRKEQLRSVYISDPVAKMSYTLIPGSKVAVSIPRIEMPNIHINVPRVRIEMDKDGKTSSKEGTTRSERVIVRTIDSDGAPGAREEVRVQVFRAGDDASGSVAPPAPPAPPVPPVPPVAPVPPVPPVPLIPGVHTLRFESMGHLGKGDTKSLGTKDIEGVKAEGKQTTWTIPAGQIGNQKPITVTSEQWYSPELQVTVYSRYNDPRAGESVYRLAAVKRAEPSADLFKVPEDYTVKGKGALKEEAKREAREAKEKAKSQAK